MRNPIRALDYLCKQCRHLGREDQFGLLPTCPQCGSREIVIAEIWSQYHREQLEETLRKGS